MYVGLTISLLLHLTVFGWALVTFQATPPLKIAEPEPVEVALISPDELVRLTRGDRASKNLETRQAEQTEQAPVRKEAKTPLVKTVPPPAAAEPPPAEQADRIEEKLAALQEPPKPSGPTPEELAAKAAAEKAAAEKAAAEKAAADLALETAAAEEKARQAAADEKRRQAEADAERKRKAEDKRRKELARKKALEREKKLAEQRRRERKEKAFDPGRILALLNKIPDSKAPAAGSPEPDQDRTLPQGARAGAPEGRDSQLTASQASLLGAMMKTAVSRCWNINSGLEGVDRIVIDIEIKLGTDGRLRGQPKVATRGSGALFQDAANNAMRALVQCEPYELPPKLYKGGWDHMIVRFDPQKMF